MDETAGVERACVTERRRFDRRGTRRVGWVAVDSKDKEGTEMCARADSACSELATAQREERTR